MKTIEIKLLINYNEAQLGLNVLEFIADTRSGEFIKALKEEKGITSAEITVKDL